MKLCTDCRYADTDRYGEMVCGRTEMINSVTGEPFYKRCEAERYDSWRSRYFRSGCGAAGVYWEAKPKPSTVVGSPTQFRWETPSGGTEDID